MLPIFRHFFMVAFASCLSVIVYLRMKKKYNDRRKAMQTLRDMKN